MKKNALFIFAAFSLASCFNQKSTTGTKITEEISIGGARDDHGCLTAAGQTWSQLKQSCLQVFDEGVRLNPITAQGSAVFSAFVLFSEDKSKLELFLPSEKKSFILSKFGSEEYVQGIYKYNVKNSTLYIDNVESYIAE